MPRRDRRADGQDLQADRRQRPARFASARSGAGSWHSSPVRWSSSGHRCTAAGSASASSFRSARSGRKCCSRSCGSVVVLGTTWRREFLSLAAEGHREVMRKANNIPIPPGVENTDGNAICMAGDRGRALHRRPHLLHRLCHSGADRDRGRRCHDASSPRARSSAATSMRRAAIRKRPNLPASTPSG